MIQIYLAAPFSRKDTAKQVRDQLASIGYTVVSQWMDYHGDSSDPVELQRQAVIDYKEVLQADVLVLLNLSQSPGKATEFGVAYAAGKECYVVGGPSGNIFYHLPYVQQCESVEDLIRALHQTYRAEARHDDTIYRRGPQLRYIPALFGLD